MTQRHDFTTRAHSLWRMRMTHLQQRFGFFSKLILACTGAGAILWSQATLPPLAWTVAAQCLGGKLLQVFAQDGGHGHHDERLTWRPSCDAPGAHCCQ